MSFPPTDVTQMETTLNASYQSLKEPKQQNVDCFHLISSIPVSNVVNSKSNFHIKMIDQPGKIPLLGRESGCVNMDSDFYSPCVFTQALD
jgi:hypothetical protein